MLFLRLICMWFELSFSLRSACFSASELTDSDKDENEEDNGDITDPPIMSDPTGTFHLAPAHEPDLRSVPRKSALKGGRGSCEVGTPPPGGSDIGTPPPSNKSDSHSVNFSHVDIMETPSLSSSSPCHQPSDPQPSHTPQHLQQQPKPSPKPTPRGNVKPKLRGGFS